MKTLSVRMRFPVLNVLKSLRGTISKLNQIFPQKLFSMNIRFKNVFNLFWSLKYNIELKFV